MSNELINSIVELQEEKAISLAREMIEGGIDPNELLNLGVEAMGKVGDRFESGQ